MLEKIIDKYYAKKLVQKLIDAISVYYIDKNVIYTKHMVELYVKKKKWKEENYVLIMAIPYSECFDVLVNRYMELEKNSERNHKKIKGVNYGNRSTGKYGKILKIFLIIK